MSIKIVSYHGSGGYNPHWDWNLWYTAVGVALAERIGETTHVIVGPEQGISPAEGDFDIAYVQSPRTFLKRPAPFIYTFIGDYRKKRHRRFIRELKPNLVGCVEAQCLEDRSFVEFVKDHGGRIELMPWFIVDKEPYVEKTIEGMCTGYIGYSRRKAIYHYLKSMKRNDIVLSCGGYGEYRLTNEEYRGSIKRTKYYFSGGILDRFIPPKYSEVCNSGACLVSHDMPRMEECGFIDGETYIKINDLGDIDDILDTDRYMKIGKAGQKMIQEKHSIEKRAEHILKVYRGEI